MHSECKSTLVTRGMDAFVVVRDMRLLSQPPAAPMTRCPSISLRHWTAPKLGSLPANGRLHHVDFRPELASPHPRPVNWQTRSGNKNVSSTFAPLLLLLLPTVTHHRHSQQTAKKFPPSPRSALALRPCLFHRRKSHSILSLQKDSLRN